MSRTSEKGSDKEVTNTLSRFAQTLCAQALANQTPADSGHVVVRAVLPLAEISLNASHPEFIVWIGEKSKREFQQYLKSISPVSQGHFGAQKGGLPF